MKLWLVPLMLSSAIHVCRTDFPRQAISFNREWKYCRGDFKSVSRPDLGDSAWERMGLPHSFSTPYFTSRDFYVDYGWYRKAFPIKEEVFSKRSFLEFNGVFQEAEVLVDGYRAGTHRGGYIGFFIDISNYLKERRNQIAVRANNC